MPKPSLSPEEIAKIRNLRKTGHTLYEIKNLTKRKSNGTIWKYIQGVSILPEYQEIWKIKRGGSKARSERDWKEAQKKASKIIKRFDFKEKMITLSCLYWGEGNKTSFDLINSDPSMIKVVIFCLKSLNVQNSELKISLRLFENIDKKKAISFWTHILSLPRNTIQKIDVIKGNKVGKLEYGMCRLRIKKGGRYFKLIMSMIDLIRQDMCKSS
ncbi:MAG: hypothetical protein NTZ87_01350 [Candidatus Nomurabacteria bacterium]|nr:hypothetical protein [Candidatus Nomurabacteria bacterium]